jgi:hypothetical protein
MKIAVIIVTISPDCCHSPTGQRRGSPRQGACRNLLMERGFRRFVAFANGARQWTDDPRWVDNAWAIGRLQWLRDRAAEQNRLQADVASASQALTTLQGMVVGKLTLCQLSYTRLGNLIPSPGRLQGQESR